MPIDADRPHLLCEPEISAWVILNRLTMGEARPLSRHLQTYRCVALTDAMGQKPDIASCDFTTQRANSRTPRGAYIEGHCDLPLMNCTNGGDVEDKK